jgi:hypothetical protein
VATLASITALLTVVLNTLAAALGAWRWWRVETSRAFWVAARAGQAAAVALAAVAGVAYVSGARPDDGLFWLYAILPLAVAFIAEQFRVLSAQAVLDQRGLENAQAVGALPADQQRSVVTQILRREMGVVALAAGVIVFLALRALSVISGL